MVAITANTCFTSEFYGQYTDPYAAASHDGRYSYNPTSYLHAKVDFVTAPASVIGINDVGITVPKLIPQYVDDFYGRIHITPTAIDLGNLLSNQVQFFDVWNAYFAPQNLSALTFVGSDDGITLTEPIVPPTDFFALESRTYQLDFDTSGPSSINLTYTFVFPSDSPTLSVTGNRIIIFTFAPDWSSPVLERLEWATQITEVEDGTETRNKLRSSPRRTFEYAFLMQTHEKRLFEEYVWAWKARVFALPIWTDCIIVTTALLINDTNINVDTTDYTSIINDGVAILWDGYDNVESVEIVSFTSTALTLIRGLTKNWPVGTKLFPVKSARMLDEVSYTQPTDDVTMGNVTFQIINNLAIPAVDSPTAYEDAYVIEKEPNRAEDMEVSTQSKLAIMDFGIASPFVDDRAGFPDQVTSYSFYATDRQDIWEWREWLHARAGRFTKFYLTQYSSDFELVQDIGAADTALHVRDQQYRAFYNTHVTKRDIEIVLLDGTTYRRRITGANLGAPGEEDISILTLGVLIPKNTVKRVSFLHGYRLDADAVEISWVTAGQAQINFNARVIEQ